MAKRSQRRSLRYEKDQGGCISGFMSIFDFRHGRSTRKLLSDRRRGSRQGNASTVLGSSSTRPAVLKSNAKFDNAKGAEKSETATRDAVKTSVKKLMEEEMIHEQVSEEQINVSREGSEELNPERGNQARKHRRRRSRTSTKSLDMDIYDGDSSRYMELDNVCQHINEQKISDSINVEAILDELYQIHHRNTDCLKNDSKSDLEMQPDRAYAFAQEKLNAAIEVFMCHRLTNNTCSREDGSTTNSKEVMDALQTISSNKELFLKLLQDPNSLLMKHIKGFEGAPLTNDQISNSLPGSNILEEVLTKPESNEPARKNRKFFRRRSKSQDSYPLEGDETCHSSSKIVILKPGLADSRYPDDKDDMSTSLHSRFSFDNRVQGDKHVSHFSFTEIKRRLKHAMGKERQVTSSDKVLYRLSSQPQNRGETEKGIGGENLGWSSPNRNHFYTERFAKPPMGFRRGDKIAQSKDVEVAITGESCGYPNHGASNIYVEAKKHLLEMVNNGETDTELTSGQLPKSLGRILSLPEYKDSARCSPEKDIEDSFISARMELSPHGTHGINDSTHQHTQGKCDGFSSSSEQNIGDQVHKTGENLHERGQFPDANCSATCQAISYNSVEETKSFHRDGIQEIEETTKTTDHEEDEMVNVLEISINTSPTSKDVQNDDAAECNEEKSSQYLELESFEEDRESSSPLASPSRSSVTTKVEDPEKATDRTDRPSPISVLESLFSEDDISPASTKDLQVELEIHPRKIHFEEQSPSVSNQGISTINCVEDGESPFEYVEAVLLGSGLNWDEFLLRWLSSDQVLDPSLFDEVELFSSRCHDQKLLFDCTNEVLKELCDCYFGRFIGVSFVKQSIWSAPRAVNLIHEIWEGVESHLLQHPSHRSLDQLVRKDMTKNEMWMNPHLDIDQIGSEMEEAIFEELVEDTISNFVDDDRECLSIDFPPVSQEIEITIDS